MNNYFYLEEPEEKSKDTSGEEVRLTRLVEAIEGLLKSPDWGTLQELHFSKELNRVESLLLSESKKETVNDRELYRLQGELKWAKRYGELTEWAKLLTNQLRILKKHE